MGPEYLQRLDEVIDTMFIPSITDGHVCSKEERILLSPPAKKGGLAIPIFSNIADQEFNFSNQMTEALVKNIKDQLRDKQVDRTEQKSNQTNDYQNTRR